MQGKNLAFFASLCYTINSTLVHGGDFMFLEFANNNGKPYIRVAESIRIEKDGKMVIRKKVIKNIGPMDKFDDGKPDFKERLKASFLSGNPLIPELLPFVPKSQPVEKYTFQITEGSPECVGHPKLFSQTLLEAILKELEIPTVVSSYKSFSKIQYDLMGYIRLLVYGRILNPASKIATVRQNESYYEPVVDNLYDYNVYDTLDFIYKHKRQIFNRINSVIAKKFSRKTDIVYYDVTNFYFEIEDPDEDLLDDSGNVMEKGIRKAGVSKENRKSPIVQMGLFLDNSGYPISYEIFPGNTLDHLTVRDSLKNTVDNMDFGRFIFVGDRGMCAYTNILHILSQGNGYVVSKSINKLSAEEKAWVFEDSDFIVQSENFKYKSRIVTRTATDENGVKHKLTEKVVVYWDRNFYNRQIRENERFLNFIQELMQNPNGFRISKTESKAVRRFLKKEYLNTETGELLDAAKLRSAIDMDKVEQYKRELGYYQIVSSEINKTEKEIIEIYHGLTRIEDQFRVMKGQLSARPVFVNTREHIDAHLAICTIALIVMRIIQNKVAALSPNTDRNLFWSYGISAARVQDALNNWTVECFPDGCYRFNNIDSGDLKLILDAFDIHIPKKLFRRGELNALKSSFRISK